MANEPDLWEVQRPTAEIALSFTIDFLGCQMGANNDQELDASATARLMKIIRAVSWVESAHGTSGPSGRLNPASSLSFLKEGSQGYRSCR